ncbi:MAG: hypothetical protein NT018_10810 [Armatimonadetes bacterium]|nr:hypothetical protein [Armatimonadota bacterium]
MRNLQKFSPLAFLIALLALCAGQLVLAAEIVDESAAIVGSLQAIVPAGKIEKSMPLAEELAVLLGGKVKWSMEPATLGLMVGPMDIPSSTLENVLRRILNAASTDYRVSGDVIVVFKLPNADSNKLSSINAPAPSKLANAQFREIMDKPLYLEFVQMPLNAALEAMLRGTGLNYIVSPEISAVKVNATLKNISLERALREVINAVGVDYRISNNTVRVTPTQTQSQGFNNQMRQPAPNNSNRGNNSNPSGSNNQKLESKSIGLKNVTAADVASVISQQGMQVSSTNSKNIVITGPEDQVKQAMNLIGALDKDQNQPGPISITIAVNLERGKLEKNSKPQVLHSFTISAFDGQPAMIGINTTISSDFIHVNVTPMLTADGRINLTGIIKLSWRFRDPKRGEINYISPETPFAALLEPSREQSVAEMKVGALTDAALDITATATIVKGRGSARPR